MDYVIKTGHGFSKNKYYFQFENLIKDLSTKLNALDKENLQPKLLINIDADKGSDDIILSYSVEKWPSYVYLITKGDNLLEMTQRLFGVLLETLEKKEPSNFKSLDAIIKNQL
jgi:hypothetical protein